MKLLDIWSYSWQQVYVTETGKKWHIDIHCSDIKNQVRYAIRIDIAKERGFRMKDICLRCKKEWME